jgi:hypothetical protein
MSTSRLYFLRSIYALDQEKDKWIVDRFTKEIEYVGEDNDMQVFTDNAQASKSIGVIIESKHAHFWDPHYGPISPMDEGAL